MGDAFRRLITVMCGVTVALGGQILVMLYGWGLEPRSWWWIVGGTLATALVGQLFIEAAKAEG